MADTTVTVSIWDRLAAALEHLLLGVNNGANITTNQAADIRSTIDSLRSMETADVASLRGEFATDEATMTADEGSVAALAARVSVIEDGMQRITNVLEGFNPTVLTGSVAATTGVDAGTTIGTGLDTGAATGSTPNVNASAPLGTLDSSVSTGGLPPVGSTTGEGTATFGTTGSTSTVTQAEAGAVS